MITSFHVKNFRGFKDLKIESLNRVNLIAGKNNVGKTALLEAFYLMLGGTNAQIPTTALNTYRNTSIIIDADEVWGWLFYQRKIQEPIIMDCFDVHNVKHELSIKMENSGGMIIPLKREEEKVIIPSQMMATADTKYKTLIVSYTTNSNTQNIKTQITPSGIELPPLGILPFPVSAYLSHNFLVSQKENADFLSVLKDKREDKELIEAMRVIEPRLKNLEISSVGGGRIMCDLGIGSGSFLPMAFMGDGMYNLLSILLTIRCKVQKGGCVLIDEIENGFHHAIMNKVWKQITRFAIQNDVQIIATTHSSQCIRSAHEAGEDQVIDKMDSVFSYYRLERNKKDDIEVIAFDHEALNTSLELGWDVR